MSIAVARSRRVARHAVGTICLAATAGGLAADAVPVVETKETPMPVVSSHRTDWMSRGSFGIMVHYLIGPAGVTPAEKTADFNRTIGAFDVPAFLDQFLSTGADWLLFTIGQNTAYYNSPNSFLDSRQPGHTAQRDLVLEIARGVKAAGKRCSSPSPPSRTITPARSTPWLGDGSL